MCVAIVQISIYTLDIVIGLYTKRVVDSGPGSLSDLVLWEIAALRWWPRSCGGRGSQSVGRVFLKKVDVF